MERFKVIIVFISAAAAAAAAVLIIFFSFIYFSRKKQPIEESKDLENFQSQGEEVDELQQREDLMRFQGGEYLTIHDILDAPGEVIGKSTYATLYKAIFQRTNSVSLLRFLRPASTGKKPECFTVIQVLGSIRHPNLVPLQAFYSGPKGEMLLVFPFFNRGNLADFLREGNHNSHQWAVIYRISIGIARAMEYLHTGLQKPIIHGNLKSGNILLDGNHQPYVSDFGLHFLLNPTTGQEMLEASGSQGYKAPELIKMKDVSKESDIYNFGIILLEIITGKGTINENPSPADLPLPDLMRNAIIDHRISDTFHPGILLQQSNHQNPVTEERLLMFVQLAMACCSPSPPLRPHIKQVLKKLEEVGQ